VQLHCVAVSLYANPSATGCSCYRTRIPARVKYPNIDIPAPSMLPKPYNCLPQGQGNLWLLPTVQLICHNAYGCIHPEDHLTQVV